jgi:hypothetical protein
MHREIGLGASSQFTVNSLVVGIPIRQQTVSQRWSGQTFRDNNRIVS